MFAIMLQCFIISSLQGQVITDIDSSTWRPVESNNTWTNITRNLYISHICFEELSDSSPPDLVQFIASMINEREDILPGYKLVFTNNVVPRMDIGRVVKAFIDEINSPPAKVMVLGPTFSSEALVIGDVSKYMGLVEMSYSATSPELSDPVKFSRFARTMETSELHHRAIVKVLKEFKWRKLAKISRDEGFIQHSADSLQRMLDSDNFTMLASSTYTTDPLSQLEHIKASGARIIMAFSTYIPGMARIFCRAYQQNMYGPRYQWLHWHGLMMFLNLQFSLGNTSVDGCDDAMVRTAIQGMIYFAPVSFVYQYTDQTIGVSGYSGPQLAMMFKHYQESRNRKYSEIFTYAIDAVWAVALTLQAALQSPDGAPLLDDFQQPSQNLSKILFREMTNLKFYGASGDVSFDQNGDRLSLVMVMQVRGEIGVPVGSYDPVADVLMWFNHTPVIFQGGNPPLDSIVLVTKDKTINRALFYTLCTCSVIGLLLCVVCVAFNIKYRNTRLVKMSSPRINTLLIAGCALSYICVILLGVDNNDSSNDWICVARTWMLVYGFTLAFGSMFSKTWRVHVLFTNKKLTRKVVKDGHLLVVVGIFLLLDTLVLVTWNSINPTHQIRITLPPEYEEGLNGEDRMITSRAYTCTSLNSIYWSAALYAFKGLLLIFGIFFAWETRKVKIEALNDSRQIGICVYNVMVMSVVAVPLVSILSESQMDIVYGVTAMAILICVTTTLVLVFGSKMVLVWFHGEEADNVSMMPFAVSLKTNQVAPATQATESHISDVCPSSTGQNLATGSKCEATTTSHR